MVYENMTAFQLSQQKNNFSNRVIFLYYFKTVDTIITHVLNDFAVLTEKGTHNTVKTIKYF